MSRLHRLSTFGGVFFGCDHLFGSRLVPGCAGYSPFASRSQPRLCFLDDFPFPLPAPLRDILPPHTFVFGMETGLPQALSRYKSPLHTARSLRWLANLGPGLFFPQTISTGFDSSVTLSRHFFTIMSPAAQTVEPGVCWSASNCAFGFSDSELRLFHFFPPSASFRRSLPFPGSSVSRFFGGVDRPFFAYVSIMGFCLGFFSSRCRC